MSELEQKVIELIARWQNRAEQLEQERAELPDGTFERLRVVMESGASTYRLCAKALAEATGVLR